MGELLKSPKLQSIDKKLLSELVQTGDFRPFLFDIFFNVEPSGDQFGEYTLIFSHEVFFIREKEMINIVENVDFPEFTTGSFLLIFAVKEDLAINTSKAKEVMQKVVKQYLKRKSITYEIQEIPVVNDRSVEICATYKIETQTI